MQPNGAGGSSGQPGTSYRMAAGAPSGFLDLAGEPEPERSGGAPAAAAAAGGAAADAMSNGTSAGGGGCGKAEVTSVGGDNSMTVEEIQPGVYKAMRARYKIPDDFLSSFDMAFRPSGGKGGDMLAFYAPPNTGLSDTGFVVKEVTGSDLETLQKFATDLKEYLVDECEANGHRSLIARFYTHFVVTANPAKPVEQLKGEPVQDFAGRHYVVQVRRCLSAVLPRELS
eukprot:SAG22_NODE_713_length_7726_cov_10.328701_1_plen_227_part_00